MAIGGTTGFETDAVDTNGKSNQLVPPGARILVVEDHLDLAANICDYLEARGWLPESAPDGELALRLLDSNDYDAVVLDLTLPRVDGLRVARRLAASGAAPPILMLTARDTLEERLEGFSAGADDYLVKPFALPELAARLAALTRRGSRPHRKLSVGNVELDLGRAEPTIAGRSVHLSSTERAILEVLLEAYPALISRARIERRLWGEDPPQDGALRTHLYTLRKALRQGNASVRITTVRAQGYRLDERGPRP